MADRRKTYPYRTNRMRKKRGREPNPESALFFFRCYVTAVIVICLFVIGLFHSETSEFVVSQVKEVISQNVSKEEIAAFAESIVSFGKDSTLQTFFMGEDEEDNVLLPESEVSSPEAPEA